MQLFRQSFFCSWLSRFVRDEKASVLPIFGLTVILLVVIAGAAFDVTRTVNAREKLSFALDAAALSLARELSTTLMDDDEIQLHLEESLKANLAGEEYLDEAITNLKPDVNPENGLVTVTSSATLENYFIDIGGYGKKLIGPETFAFGTSTQVTYSQFEVEIALVLDVTGSMGFDDDDIEALRTAAKDLVNELIPTGTEEEDSKFRISVVPYSQGVNLGAQASAVTNGEAGAKHCVTERSGGQQFTDAIYNYAGSDSEFFGGAGKVLIRNGRQQSVWGENCPDEEILPLTANRSALDKKIEALEASGGTAGQTGIAWGWYTLAPSWGALWPSSAPEPYGAGKPSDDIRKYAIVMTDGDFNNYFKPEDYTTTKEVCGWVKSSSGRRKRWDCWYETTTNTIWTEYYQDYANIYDQSAVRGLEYCERMKDKNIHVYAIYFETRGSDFGEDLMRDCASDDSFFLATSSDSLVTAFGNIAKEIQAIYVSR